MSQIIGLDDIVYTSSSAIQEAAGMTPSYAAMGAAKQQKVKLNKYRPRASCEGCTLCCKVLQVKELDKPVGRHCDHCKAHKGCQIYDRRPEECKIFRCLWIQNKQLPAELKPSFCHVVMFDPDIKEAPFHVVVDPKTPNAWRVGAPWRYIKLLLERGHQVAILCGDDRKLLRANEKVVEQHRLAVTAAEEGQLGKDVTV